MNVVTTYRAALVSTALLAFSSPEAFSQIQSGPPSAPVKMAVIEFSPEPAVSGMSHEAKRHLQASMAFALHSSLKYKRFNVVDVRHTRDASAANLAAINGGTSTAAAVKVGKQLGVKYVLTGTVAEYTPKGPDGFGRVILKTRFIEVATGEVKHAAETTQRSISAMNSDGAAEIQAKAIMPAIQKLTATLVGLKD